MRQTFFAENTLASAVELMGKSLKFLQNEGLTPRSLFIAELTLEEMLTNIVKYAYDDEAPHRVEVVAEVEHGRVNLELYDDGHYFDPTQVAAPAEGVPVSQRALGGRGIHLVRKLVARFDYQREGSRNVLRIGFPAAAQEPSIAG